MASNYTLKAGYVMTVTAGATKASVQEMYTAMTAPPPPRFGSSSETRRDPSD